MSSSLLDQLAPSIDTQATFPDRAALYDFYRLDPSHSRQDPDHRKAGKRREHNRSVLGIVQRTDGRREYLHATKGWKLMPREPRPAPDPSTVSESTLIKKVHVR